MPSGRKDLPFPYRAKYISWAGKPRDAYLFGDGETPMRHENYHNRVFVPAARAQGLDGLRHYLRHFYASDLLRDTHLPVKDVAVRLGHADAILVLRTYGHLFDDSGKGLGSRVSKRRKAARKQAKKGAITVVSLAKGFG